jgi:hypothetical protein
MMILIDGIISEIRDIPCYLIIALEYSDVGDQVVFDK